MTPTHLNFGVYDGEERCLVRLKTSHPARYGGRGATNALTAVLEDFSKVPPTELRPFLQERPNRALVRTYSTKLAAKVHLIDGIQAALGIGSGPGDRSRTVRALLRWAAARTPLAGTRGPS